ncbi:tRNA modification GTPase [Flavobacterium sp.]|uniref:tRNA modification GTPase n=1 Tax=Flavobacterium sp. TaxID=239 RepID=UPI004047615D
MKKQIFLLLIVLFSINSFSQILFEKGYYINNEGNKIEGLIKNIDWQNNPTNFEFKSSELAQSETIKIESAQEFGTYNFNKYIRYSINIDRSSEFMNNISQEKNPKFILETLFLKVLIEGNANLLQYTDKSLNRYFFSVNKSDLTQLVYKSYENEDRKVLKNNEYRQQLFNSLKCDNISTSTLLSVDYNKKDLVKIFKKYNTCSNSENITYEEPKVKRDIFNLNLRPGINYSSLELDNVYVDRYDLKYTNQVDIRFGIEAEFILPFNKNKWSVIVEPTYHNYKNEGFILNGAQRVTVNYKALELPIGIRYYMFLNDKSKIFVNGSFFINNSGKSNILFEQGSVNGSNYNFENPRTLQEIPIKTSINYGFGVGYKFKNKYSIEYRFHTRRRILEIPSTSNPWDTKYNISSFIIGYTLF